MSCRRRGEEQEWGGMIGKSRIVEEFKNKSTGQDGFDLIHFKATRACKTQ